MGKRILVLSSYHSDISLYWAARLGELFPEAELKLVSLPPQNFAWGYEERRFASSIKKPQR